MVGDAEYKKLIADLRLNPMTYNWESNEKGRYHAMISIEDLPIVLAIPGDIPLGVDVKL